MTQSEAQPPPPPKRSRRKQARPSEIITAALSLFAERGFAATKLDDVAARAGISKGTVYLYFADKDALFQAVVRQELLPVIARFEAMVDSYQGPTEDLLRSIAIRFEQVMESELGGIPKLVLAESGNFPEIAKFYADEVVARGLRLFTAIMDRGVVRGEFRDIEPRDLLPVFVGPVLMLLLWKHSIGRHGSVSFNPSSVLATHLDMFLRALAPETSR